MSCGWKSYVQCERAEDRPMPLSAWLLPVVRQKFLEFFYSCYLPVREFYKLQRAGTSFLWLPLLQAAIVIVS